MAEIEVWKALPGVNGVEVSQLGKVRTLDRIGSRESGTYSKKGHILKQSNANGYLLVTIPVDGKFTTKGVHRLVAQTFIPNPYGLPEVNHKDCDRKNNNAINLEWCNHSYNAQYREKFGEALGRPVFAINLSTLEVSRYPSQIEASRKLGIDQSNISRVIRGRQKQVCGYWFVNADEHAVDLVNKNLHDVGKTGLKIKRRAT